MRAQFAADAPGLSRDLTNERFLEIVFGDQWPRALIAGFTGDPQVGSDANWTAFPARMLPPPDRQAALNMYFCPSLARGTRRSLGDFISFHVLVVDDYGTKVPEGVVEDVLGTGPDYVLETSPGNCQAGWLLEAPIADLAVVRGLLRQLKVRIGKADNITDPMTWRRLPVVTNGKPKNRGWRVRVRTLGDGFGAFGAFGGMCT